MLHTTSLFNVVLKVSLAQTPAGQSVYCPKSLSALVAKCFVGNFPSSWISLARLWMVLWVTSISGPFEKFSDVEHITWYFCELERRVCETKGVMKGSAARSAIDDLDFSENRSRPLVMNRCVIQVLPCVYLCQTTSSQFINRAESQTWSWDVTSAFAAHARQTSQNILRGFIVAEDQKLLFEMFMTAGRVVALKISLKSSSVRAARLTEYTHEATCAPPTQGSALMVI